MTPARRARLDFPSGARAAIPGLVIVASVIGVGIASGQERPRLVVLEGGPEPSAVAELVVAAGAAWESPDQAGLASVLAGVLAAEVGAGADVAVLGWAEPDRLAFRILAPEDSLAAVTRRLIGVLSDPEIPEGVLDGERSRIRAALQSRLLSPEVVAARSLTRRLFPGHPYGNLETPATVSGLERRDLLEFHRRNVGPAGSLLVVGGVGPSSSVGEELRTVLAEWEATGQPGARERGPTGVESAGAPLPPAAGVPVHIVDVPGAARASIHIGQRLPATPPREWAALTVAVELAALENDRTFRRWEAFQGEIGPIPSVGGVTRQRLASLLRFQVQVPTHEADRALQTILETVDRARRTLYPPDRLDSVRDRLIQRVDAERGSVERVARLAAYYSVGLGTDPDGAFRDWLISLDAYDLREAMSGSVHTDSLQVVIAGDAARLVPLLEPFGPVTVADARAVTAANGNRPLPLSFGQEGAGGGRGDGLETVAVGPPLAPGEWVYRVLVEGREEGRMTREILADPKDGTMTVRTVLEAGGLVQYATVRFEPATLGMIEAQLRLTGGVDDLETELRSEGGSIRGRRRSARAGASTAIDGALPAGALVGELLELALWRMDLEVGEHVRLPFIDPGTGQGQIADVVVLGTGTAVGPRGDEETLVVEVVTGGLRQRLHLRTDPLRVPIASEIVGQPLRLELIEERTSGSETR